MNNYNRDKMFKREDSYPKAIRIAVLVAIFFHIGLLYGFRHSDPPEKLEPPKPTPIIRVHSLPPSEPTPPPKRTQPPRVQISEDKRLVPKRPPKVKEPVAVPLPMNPELDPMEIEPDWAQIVDDIPEPEPIDADPYDYHNPDIVPPVVIKRVAPEYPRQYAKLGIQGATHLRCIITKNGLPEDIEVVRSFNTVCDKVAMEALDQWRFNPATLNDVPVDVIMEITIRFRLN